MKSSLLIFLMLIGTFQDSVPPQKIINALNKKFPSAVVVKWLKQEYSGYWKASFILGGKRATCTFSSDAKWFETTLEIQGKDLIEIVKKSVMEDYPKCEILSAVITEWSFTTWYQVKIKCGTEIIEVKYDYQGFPYPKIT